MLNNSLILPTSFLAPVEYYSIATSCKSFFIEHKEYFVKQTIRNRCLIHSANGKILLTIPKKKHKRGKVLVEDIMICYEENWQKKHWKSIESAYNSSPFFEYYKEELKSVFFLKEKFLIDYNQNLNRKVLEIIGHNPTIHKTNVYVKRSSLDFRKYNWNKKKYSKYCQVFEHKNGFISNLSIIDLIFNLGTETIGYLQNKNI